MNVLSLFDGMSCGQIALDKLGIKPDHYFAAEVDKYAIQVTKANYPNTIHLGDVRDVMWPETFEGIKIDLLIGGSPCQGFSFAGKQLNFDDPRSKLFWEYVRLLKECKPKYFLLENVRMKQESMDVITEALGVEPIFINSSLVSAQNRQRYYWTNIPFDGVPEDKGIMLRDILETTPVDAHYEAGKHLVSGYKGGNQLNPSYKSQANTIHSLNDKSGTLCAGTHGYSNGYIPTSTGLVQVGETEEYQHYNNSQIKRVYHPDGKAPTLLINQGGNREPKVATHDPKGGRIVNRRLDENGTRKDYDKSIPLQPRVEVREDDKTNCLSTVYKDSVVVEDMTWRKLTPLECERLQTVPDGYTAHVSNTQRYKMLGNGWTVDVITHIMKGMEQ